MIETHAEKLFKTAAQLPESQQHRERLALAEDESQRAAAIRAKSTQSSSLFESDSWILVTRRRRFPSRFNFRNGKRPSRQPSFITSQVLQGDDNIERSLRSLPSGSASCWRSPSRRTESMARPTLRTPFRLSLLLIVAAAVVLPLGHRLLRFTPALSSSPGHAPTHETRFLAEAKDPAVGPTSFTHVAPYRLAESHKKSSGRTARRTQRIDQRPASRRSSAIISSILGSTPCCELRAVKQASSLRFTDSAATAEPMVVATAG